MSLRKFLLLLCIIKSSFSCYAHDFSDQELEIFLENVKYAGKIITDEASKNFLRSILDDTSLIENDDVIDRALGLFKRAHMVMQFDAFLSQGLIKRKGTVEKVDIWLKNQTLLDDATVRSEASQVLELIRERLQKGDVLLKQIQWLNKKVKDPKQKIQIMYWLKRPMLFYDEDEQPKIELFVNQVMQTFGKEEEKSLKRFKVIKNLSMIAYAAYRKGRLISSLWTGEPVGKISYFDSAAALAYLLSEEWEQNEKVPFGLFLLMTLDRLPLKMDSWKYKWKSVTQDEIGKYVRESAEKLYKKRLLRVIHNPNHRYHNEYNNPNTTRQRRRELQLDEYNRSDRAIRNLIQETGYEQKILDFYDVFDRQIDKVVEGGVDDVLEKIRTPKFLRKAWKNSSVGFVRRMALMKFLPTYLYWYFKDWSQPRPDFSELPYPPANNQNAQGGNQPQENNQNQPQNNNQDQQGANLAGPRPPYASHEFSPFKEAIKSTSDALRWATFYKLKKALNGKKDKDGKGSLDRSRERSWGLLGPNLLSEILDISFPRMTIALLRELKGLEDGEQGILVEEDYYYNRNIPGAADRFRKDETNWRIHVPRSVFEYIGRNFSFYCLSKGFNRYGSRFYNWFSTKTVNFVDFLSRRGWIDYESWNNIKKEFKENTQLQGQADFKMMFGMMLTSLYILIKGPPKKMSSSDIEQAWLAIRNTKNSFTFFEYILAFMIGEQIGKACGKYCMDRLAGPEDGDRNALQEWYRDWV